MRNGTTFVATLLMIVTAKAVDLEGVLTRPLRPLNTEIKLSCGGIIRPSFSDIRAAVELMRETKRTIQAERGKTWSEVRQELREIRESRIAIRWELHQSVKAAKQQAQENARKISEELREEARGRDR